MPQERLCYVKIRYMCKAFGLNNMDSARSLVSSQLTGVSFVVNLISAMYYSLQKLLSSPSKGKKVRKSCQLLDVAAAVVTVSGRQTSTIFVLWSTPLRSPIFDSLNSPFPTFYQYICMLSGSLSCSRGSREVKSQVCEDAITRIPSGSVALVTFT